MTNKPLNEDLLGLLREARDNAIASTAEEDISADRRAYRRELAERLNSARAALAAPSQPVGSALRAAAEQLVAYAEDQGNVPWRKAMCAYFAEIFAAALTPEPAALTGELQRQCSEWGAYWRASDAHGVELTKPQAIELLQTALRVEVEIKDNGCIVCDGTGIIGRAPDDYQPCPDCTPAAQPVSDDQIDGLIASHVGLIGGPSYYAPDEGGVPCPDCAVAQPGEAVPIYQRAQDEHRKVWHDIEKEEWDRVGTVWRRVVHIGVTPIAAAAGVPELLKALATLVRHAENPAHYGSVDVEDIDAALSAIAKATGANEQPAAAVPAAWAATSEDGEVEALGMNQSRRFDTPLYLAAPAQAAAVPEAVLTDEQLIAEMPADIKRSAPWYQGVWLRYARRVLALAAPEAGAGGDVSGEGEGA